MQREVVTHSQIFRHRPHARVFANGGSILGKIFLRCAVHGDVHRLCGIVDGYREARRNWPVTSASARSVLLGAHFALPVDKF